MKKNYVNLNVQVVEVQLSDCIAGSVPPVSVMSGMTENNEVDAAFGRSTVRFEAW